MFLLTKRFHLVPWYGNAQSLAESFPGKDYLSEIRTPSPTGNGDIAWINGSQFPSLTSLEPSGTSLLNIYRITTKNLPEGGFLLNNGEAPTGTASRPVISNDPSFQI